MGEAIASYLSAVGIRTRVRTMERATFLAAWREKKLRGLVFSATGAAGNAAARLEPFFTKSGVYAYGTRPEIDDLFQRQANEIDRGKREALLHQIQKIVIDQALVAPVFQQAFLWGVGARVEQPAAVPRSAALGKAWCKISTAAAESPSWAATWRSCPSNLKTQANSP